METRQAQYGQVKTVSRRSFLCLAGSLAMCAALPKSAFATTWGQTQFRTEGGISYAFYAGIDGGLSPVAYSHVSANPGIGAGELAASAQLFNGLGWLVASSGYVYGNGSSADARVGASQSPAGSQARGLAVSWHGGSYYFYNSYTPVTYGMRPDYCMNDYGQTFGSLMSASIESPPDLVEVVSDEGIFGYVSFAQIFGVAVTPSEVPVYAEDGQTMVGVFTFGDK